MFGKLQQASRLNDNGSWPYLRSHPLTTQRIADMDSRIPPGKRAADPVPTLEHVMMSARARVISNPGVEVRRQWARLPRSGSFSSLSQFEQVAQLYAATLSAMYLRDWPLAREMVQRLLAATAGNAPANIQARWLNAELEFKADNPQAALAALPLQSGNAPQAAPRVTASGNLAGPREAGPSLATIDVVEQVAPRRPSCCSRRKSCSGSTRLAPWPALADLGDGPSPRWLGLADAGARVAQPGPGNARPAGRSRGPGGAL
jgi:hypothetical protein